jgi:hypothetical protein
MDEINNNNNKSYNSNEVWDFIYGAVMVVTWFHEELAQMTNRK